VAGVGVLVGANFLSRRTKGEVYVCLIDWFLACDWSTTAGRVSNPTVCCPTLSCGSGWIEKE